jgi:hypothetical protein
MLLPCLKALYRYGKFLKVLCIRIPILYSDPDPGSYVHSDLALDPISITLNFDPL